MATTYDPTTADLGTLERIDRNDVIVDLNVRKDIRLDKSFISSIRVRGFEQYPVGWRDEDGKAHVVVGQRRVSAALEIDWPVIPIVIKTRVAAEADRAEEQRLLTQLAENEQRAPLTDAEIAAGYKQLALVGVSEDQIARKTNSPRTRVKTALAVAGSAAASAAVGKLSLTLDQAAIYTEFDGDADAVARLDQVAAERPDQLQHEAERIRNERADAEVIARLSEEIRAQAAEPHTEVPSGAEAIGQLWRADDDSQKRLTLAQAKKYAGLVGVVYRSGWESPTGENRGYKILWFLTGWKDRGLTTWGARQPVSDEEKARRKQKRQDKADMRAATVVRREWLRDVLLADGHKLDTDSALRWIAGALWHTPGHLSPSIGRPSRFALELLGISDEITSTTERDPDTGNHLHGTDLHVRDVVASRDSLRVALAMAIARTEAVVGDEKGDAFGQDNRTAKYFRQLRDWGYTLAPIEEGIADHATSTKKAAA
ncbi:MAG: chromosome partitioning protein ParB [Microbacterium sp.]|jgi:ParB family chromosome partitioning protein|nr:chromosome partitioning protein ParB [Microbacterium sp.]